jgi:hypothetical protein
MRGICCLHNHDRFNANPKVTLLIIAGLVCDHHARLQANFEHGRALHRRANTVRSFVHIQKRANAVASAVIIVQADLPKRRARQNVERRARCSLGKHNGCERNVPFQDARKALHLVRSRLAKMNGSSDVGRAITGEEMAQMQKTHVQQVKTWWKREFARLPSTYRYWPPESSKYMLDLSILAALDESGL